MPNYLARERKGKSENAPFSYLRGNRDAATVGFHDPFGNIEAKAQSCSIVGVELRELAKNLFFLFGTGIHIFLLN